MIVSERIQKHFTIISENSLNFSRLGRTIPAYSQCKTSVLIPALLVFRLIIMSLIVRKYGSSSSFYAGC